MGTDEVLAADVREVIESNATWGIDALSSQVDAVMEVVATHVAARVAEALAPAYKLADQWDELGDNDSAFWWSTLATHLRAALPIRDLVPSAGGEADE